MGIDESTVDKEEEDEENGDDVHSMGELGGFEQDSESGKDYKPNFGMLTRGESYSVFENPNQGGMKQLALQAMMQQMAKKIGYNNEKINDINNQSVIFHQEL